MGSRLPNFLIVGAMRAGTTMLARSLERHPQTFVPLKKELHYFERYFERDIAWYESEFSGARETAIAVGESTPSYMFDPSAIERIAAVLPEVRLIASLREPVQRAYSHFWHERARGRDDRTFEAAVASELESLGASGTGLGTYPGYLARGHYRAQVDRLMESFPPDALHVVLFEELRADAPGVFGGVCRFLGIDDDVPPLLSTPNPYARFRSVRFRDAYQRWPRRLRNAAGRLNRVQMDYPPIADRVRDELQCHFESHNVALADWLGRDTGWNR